ncbi:MAG: hypothetical protein ACYC2R_09220 [Burkholderiales bacterium]
MGFVKPKKREKFDVWAARIRAPLSKRDAGMILHLAESYKVPIHRLYRLVEEVDAWRVDEYWIAFRNTRFDAEAQPRTKDLEFEALQDSHQGNTRRLFGLQPRKFQFEFAAAVRHLANQRQVEDDAQRQNQEQLQVELKREMDAILDSLLQLGYSMDAIRQKLVLIGWSEGEIEDLLNG